ncbi:MAG: tetratricopeptide repeat protein [Salinibacter sp.]
MTTRRPLLASLLATALVLATMAGCSGGNPFMSTAESAMEDENYDRALANIDSALVQDSANVEAYQMRAQVLRQMSDTTMDPDEYRELWVRAREAEEQATEFDSGVRDDIQGRRQLAYFNEFQRGANAFNRAQEEGDSTAFRVAASSFGAAGATYPDSAATHLNEAYARINLGEREGSIPVLERYMEAADTAETNAYAILGRLYISNDQADEAISLLEDGTEMHPDEDELQSLLLNAYQQSGDTERALEAYQQQVEQEPDNATFRYNYGSLLLSEDRLAEAIDQLQEAVDLDSDNAKAQYNLGAAFVNQAVALNDSIATIEDDFREEDREATEEEAQRMKKFAQQRQQAFQNAIPPLERARQLSGSDGEYREDACRALFQAYVQTERSEQAADVEQCAGFEEGRAEEIQEEQEEAQQQQGGGGN